MYLEPQVLAISVLIHLLSVGDENEEAEDETLMASDHKVRASAEIVSNLRESETLCRDANDFLEARVPARLANFTTAEGHLKSALKCGKVWEKT